MKVLLTYYKRTGKFYSLGDYETTKTEMWEIWNEVKGMVLKGELPGLVERAREFIVSINVPDHPHNHPHLDLTTLHLEDVL